MRVKEIILKDKLLIKDDTKIVIRREESGRLYHMRVCACGCWYCDRILMYLDAEVESFSWQDDNKVYIDVK